MTIEENTIIKPIRSRRLSEIAVDQITSLIESGHLQIGDKLPSERELMDQLGVSRASVREALRVLESQGLIIVQPGKGAFIAGTVSQADVLESLVNWLKSSGNELLDVIAVRAVLESYAVQLAVDNCPKETIKKLRNAIDKMRTSIEHGASIDATRADREFHKLLYEASGNSFLKMLGDSIVASLHGARHSVLRIPGRARQSLEEHEAIIDAISEKDPQKALGAVDKHIRMTREILSKILSENTHDNAT